MTIPNVLATIAVFVAASGTAYAAILVTGKHVKDSSLTGTDVMNSSIASVEFTALTAMNLRVRGEDGAPGPAGPQGSPGTKGLIGAKGTPAPRAFTFQSLERNTRVGSGHANPGSELGYGIDCTSGPDLVGCPTSPTAFPRWSYWCSYQDGPSRHKHCKTTNASVPQMSRTFQTVLVTADNPNGGILDMPYNGTIVLNATATFFTQRAASNQRLECQLQVARVENGVRLPAQNVGEPVMQYRHIDRANLNKQERLLNISANGAIALTAGKFETWLACRGPDDDSDQNHRLEFIEGNVSVLSTRTNGQA